MDTIFLHGLKIECVVGAWEWERQIKQIVYVDLDMGADIGKAAESDDINDTLNYKEVSKQVTELVQDKKYHLVEAMAQGIAELLINGFNVPWCRVRVNKKGAVSAAEDVGVIVERGEKS